VKIATIKWPPATASFGIRVGEVKRAVTLTATVTVTTINWRQWQPQHLLVGPFSTYWTASRRTDHDSQKYDESPHEWTQVVLFGGE